MVSFTIDDGYYDDGRELDQLILKKGNRFFWDLNFISRGQFYFTLIIEIKKRIRLKGKDLKIGIIDQRPTYIGFSEEKGCFWRGIVEINCGKIIIDQPILYHLFIETELSSIKILKLSIKYFPIPIQGSPEIAWSKNELQAIISEPFPESSKHSKAIILSPSDIPSKLWSYYQSFKIIRNYPFSYYAINFGIGNLGIQFNQTLKPLLNLTIWKKNIIEIIDQDDSLKIIGQKKSPTLRFEKKLKESSTFAFLIRVRHIEVDQIHKTEFQFFSDSDSSSLKFLLTIRIQKLLAPSEKKYEFYVENVGNINGHLYQREIEVNPSWALTYDLTQAIPLLKNYLILKEKNASYSIINSSKYLVKYAGYDESYQNDQDKYLEISSSSKVKLPKLRLTSSKKG